jgi:hypothetical protein
MAVRQDRQPPPDLRFGGGWYSGKDKAFNPSASWTKFHVVQQAVQCSKTDRLMSDSGLVSRVSPVQTALRNCTRDEGRSFEVGNQVLISSHRKLLLSKAMVVNVAETSGLDSDRQG